MFAEIIHGNQIFSTLEGEWDDLVRRSMTDTPFQTLAYQRSWWKHLHPSDGELHSIVVRAHDHTLVAIACLYVTEEGVVNFNGCVEETDYLDLIAEARHAAEAWRLIFECLHSHEYPAWQRLELCNVPEVSPTRTALSELSEEHSYCVVESINEVCPIIELPATFDQYLDMLDGKQRREIRRKLRRAEAAGAEFIIVAKDDISSAVDEFLDLLQKSTTEKRDWLTEGRRKLFLDVAKAAQQAGTLQLSFVRMQDQNAAALFNFDYENRIWVYNSGLDPEAFGSLSLGVMATVKAIEWAIDNGRSEFDFLRGSETYKYHFGAEDTSIYRLQISRD